MIQEFIYKKDITREINGVIKADSTSALSEEITEYDNHRRAITPLAKTVRHLSSSHTRQTVYGFQVTLVVVSLTCLRSCRTS